MRMKRFLLCMLSCFVLGSTILTAAVDLKIRNLELAPKPAYVEGQGIQLDTHGAYRVVVTIQKSAALPTGASFVVRTECIRNGKSVIIGEARVGDSKGWNIYACYDLYPGEAGLGLCRLRTTIDADNEIVESNESAISHVYDTIATLVGY